MHRTMSNLENETKPENKEETGVPKAPEQTEEKKAPEPKKTNSHNPLPRLREVGQHVPLGPGNFWNNMLSTVLLLVLVTMLFSYITDTRVTKEHCDKYEQKHSREHVV